MRAKWECARRFVSHDSADTSPKRSLCCETSRMLLNRRHFMSADGQIEHPRAPINTGEIAHPHVRRPAQHPVFSRSNSVADPCPKIDEFVRLDVPKRALGLRDSTSPMRGDVKEKYSLRPLREEKDVATDIQPDPISGEALCSRRVSDRARQSTVSARRFHNSMVRRLRSGSYASKPGGSSMPTMVLFETRSL